MRVRGHGRGKRLPAFRRRVDGIVRRWSGRLRRRVAMARMEKADIVLASPRLSRLSATAILYRLFLGSRYVHSMLYLGGGRILHTTSRRGVTVGRLPGKIFRRERYAVYRAKTLSAEGRERVVRAALARKDRKLDHAALVTNIPARWLGLRNPLWRLEAHRLWCSRLIYESYLEAGIELVPEGKAGTITSEDLSRSPALERL